MKEKLIAKIEEIYGYNQRRKKPVFYGYISGYKRIDLFLLLERGLSCQNCIFKMYGACCLLPHKTVALDKKWKFDDECIFPKSIFEPNEKYRHELDERRICEFYSFRPVYSKENDIRKWYEEEGDEVFFQKLPIEFSEFSENMEHILIVNKKKREELEKNMESKDEELGKMKRTLKTKDEKLEDMNKFIKFFQSELPDVYKNMRKEFNARSEYD